MEENGICSAAFCESAALRNQLSACRKRAKLLQSKPNGFDSSLGEGASGMAEKFPAKAESLRACPLPLGGAVAQRLRGF